LRHSFGFQHLPLAEGGFDKILIRLDTHSSQRHKRQLFVVRWLKNGGGKRKNSGGNGQKSGGNR
jgi:hypothetical protein